MWHRTESDAAMDESKTEWEYQRDWQEYSAILTGADIDLRMLAHCFTRTDARIVCINREGGTVYALQSSGFILPPKWESHVSSDGVVINLNANWKFVGDTAEEILRAMNGAARLSRPSFHPATIRRLECHDLSGAVCGATTWQFTTPDEVRRYAFPPARTGLVDLLQKWVELARSSAPVDQALHIIGAFPITWSSLYLIFEIVCADMGGEAEMLKRHWIKRTMLNRFTTSANHARSIKEGARHGGPVKRGQKPAATIDLMRAHTFIVQLLNGWLAEKVGGYMR
jgi:hypothetical protein